MNDFRFTLSIFQNVMSRMIFMLPNSGKKLIVSKHFTRLIETRPQFILDLNHLRLNN